MSPQFKAVDKFHQCRWAELGFEGLAEAEKRYVGIFWVSGDVSNGGFDQYFHNSSGDLAPYALSGLQEVGASATAALLAEAMALIPDGYIVDQDVRQQRLARIPDDEDRFGSVTRRLYASEEPYEDMYLDYLGRFYHAAGIRKNEET